MKTPRLDLAFHPLTSARWRDLEKLFGESGACGGCWCMLWRLARADFEKKKGSGNKRALRRLVKTSPPGLLAYVNGKSIGWCAVDARASYPALQRSRILRPVDDQPVWSIVCLFVAKPMRKRGVSTALIEAAAQHAKSNGAVLVEGYPVEARKPDIPAPFVWTGLASAFRRAGFIEVARRSPTRPIMRFAGGEGPAA